MRQIQNMRVAVVGSGVSGLVSAHLLQTRYDVTLYEADGRPGGHTNTVEIELDGVTHAVDTGFIVYNERTYPGFVALLDHLGVATKESNMSFSVSDERTGIEWRGTSPSTLFAQRRNLANPAFHRMLIDVARFNRAARRLVAGGPDPDLSLGEFLASGTWSRQFVDWYLVPMGSAIWSADPRSFAEIPIATYARFFDNHGLLRLGDQPKWRTIAGGADRYVEAMLRPLAGRVRYGTGVEKVVRRPDQGAVELRTEEGELREFDHVVLATHSDQALRLLADPRLQGISSGVPILVTLNRHDDISPSTVLGTFEYDHPVLDAAAVRAQARRDEISGRHGTWFAGAYWGYGFHEDGVQSALHVCRALGVEAPW
jgi:predicted NAD/FAD-binding protein